jgi:dephospho-CoA kinase
MLRLGLTGSIGTGKSTTSGMFRRLGIPVYDADATVHALYAGEAAPLIEAGFPGSTREGRVDRKALSLQLAGRPDRFRALEAIVHPLVRARELEAHDEAKRAGHTLLVLDIPLLFETGGERRCDLVLVTTVDPAEQKRRVMARPGMTEALFHDLLHRQMPDREKRARAHAMIDTGFGLAAAEAEIRALLRAMAPMLSGKITSHA